MAKIDSIYIHIPFCKSICSYCDFCKVLYKKEWVDLYLQKLKEEIIDRYMGNDIKTIYIGGGTPSALSLNEIEYLLQLTNLFKKDKLVEFTFECNIEDINEDLLLILKKYRVNRLSIGIQSFNNDNLKILKRTSNYQDVIKKVKLMRHLNFNNINLDLMYALPNEPLNILKKDLKLLLNLKPEHISCYSLILEDHTYLKYQKIEIISEDLDLKMYEYIRHKLKRNGYHHYEISNFAKKGYESIHNLTYWKNNEYYGFGCGASGYIDSIRYENTKNLSSYLKGNYNGKEELLSEKSTREYELMLGLRKTDGISLQEFYNKYHINMQDVFPIKPLIKNKDLIYKNGNIMINHKKLYIMNEILLKLI